MNRIRRILVATDCSEYAHRAETRAAMLSFELRANALEMMTVQTPGSAKFPDDGSWLTGQLDAVEEDPGHTVHARRDNSMTLVRSVRPGDPTLAVLSRAAEMQADLTVVAGNGGNLRGDLFVRAGNHELVLRTETPLMLVHREPRSAYRRILVAVNFTPACHEAARFAVEMAPAACFMFVHAYQLNHESVMRDAGLSDSTINAAREHGCQAARARLHEFIDSLGARKVLIGRTVEAGHPVRVVGGAAQRSGADLIVIGRNENAPSRHLAPGSITHRLMLERDADVMVVPAPTTDEWFDLPAA